MVRIVSLLAGLALAACSSNGTSAQETAAAPVQTAETPAVSPAGLQLIDVTIVSGETKHSFKTELAATQQEQAKGMMFRTEMGDDEGMLFPSYTPQLRSFWMKNTPLPLDIIFIGPDRRILNIAADTPPYTEENVSSDGITSGVLELIGGRAAELGLKPGDKVDW